MNINFHSRYIANYGDEIVLYIEDDKQNLTNTYKMSCIDTDLWLYSLEIEDKDFQKTTNKIHIKARMLRYDSNNNLIDQEQNFHNICLNITDNYDFDIELQWNNNPINKVFDNKVFDILNFNITEHSCRSLDNSKINLLLNLPYIKPSYKVVLLGESDILGNWTINNAIKFERFSGSLMLASIDKNKIDHNLEYKIALINRDRQNIIWEKGENRLLRNNELVENKCTIISISSPIFESYIPKYSGVVAPLFSLRHKKDFGIGDFASLKKLIDWAKNMQMSVVQLLPIYDSNYYMDYRDSYPYNAISTTAINPLYMDLSEFIDEKIINSKKWQSLRIAEEIIYPKVAKDKMKLIFDTAEREIAKYREKTDYQDFISKHKNDIEPYIDFYYSNDIAGFRKGNYDREILYWVQYILDRQLTCISDYAKNNGIILKGDLPIGVNPNGIDCIINKEYLNHNLSAGAPPDDFARDGQNWGFPTYNWENISYNDYEWWHRRFASMSKYFSAIRIDHILGFFRIWSIPRKENKALLGYFVPSIGLDKELVNSKLDDDWSIENLSKVNISKSKFNSIFTEKEKKDLLAFDIVKEIRGGEFYQIQDNGNLLQEKISKKTFEKLQVFSDERLFVMEETSDNNIKYHPRISPEWTDIYRELSPKNQSVISEIAYSYFYIDNDKLWRDTAISRLSNIFGIDNQLLLCAEDLGMLPYSVPEVLSKLSMLSLDIERMPKKATDTEWERIRDIHYMSVVASSTHDMPPLKLWWQNLSENQKEKYQSTILKNKIEDNIYKEIINNHNASSAMMCILPLGDWLSPYNIMSQKAEDEQINHPENPNHHWVYRFPFYMEDLLENDIISQEIKETIKKFDRNSNY